MPRRDSRIRVIEHHLGQLEALKTLQPNATPERWRAFSDGLVDVAIEALRRASPLRGETMRRTRRDDIYEYVCRYADEMDGPTPSIHEIALHFGLNYKTVYFHVMKLIVEGRLRQERGKLVVVGSEWLEPPPPPVRQQRFDF